MSRVTSFDPTTGKAVVIDFIRNGENHRSFRWGTDIGLFDTLVEDEHYFQEIRKQYADCGAEVISIGVMETSVNVIN